MNDQNLSQAESVQDSFEKVAMIMQVDLMKKFYSFEPDNTQAEKWINDHSKLFRELFNKHPEIAQEYILDKESALIKMEELLYSDDTVEK